MKHLGFVAISIFLLTPAHSQVADQTCLKMAEAITVGVRKNYSESQYEAMRHYANCQASESSTGASIDIGFKAFTLGGKYDGDRKKTACTKDMSETKFATKEYVEAKEIFDKTLKTIDRCLQLAARGWIINVATIQSDAVSVSIANTSVGGGRIDAIESIPRRQLTCDGMPKKFPISVDAKGLTMTCEREATTQVIDGVSYSSSKDVTLNLRLAEQPFPITISGYSDSPITDLTAKISGIERKFDTLRGNLGAWSPQPENAGNLSGGGDPKPATTCPPGTYVVGLKWWGSPGSTRYCIGCGSGFQVICRKLNAG